MPTGIVDLHSNATSLLETLGVWTDRFIPEPMNAWLRELKRDIGVFNLHRCAP